MTLNEDYIVGENPDGNLLVFSSKKDGYTILLKGQSINDPQLKWHEHGLIDSAVIKGGFKRLKNLKPYTEDKVEKGRKSLQRLDSEDKPKKKSKNEQLILDLGLQNVSSDLVSTKVTRKSEELFIDLEKANNSHLPTGAERHSYKTHTNYDVIHIPVNRLKQIYQTDEALNPKKVKENMKKIKDGTPLSPVEIGYNYDVHDGHHRWEAAKNLGHTHVPCKVVGQDPDKVKEAKEKYRSVWKSDKDKTDYISNLLLSDFVDVLQGKEKRENLELVIQEANDHIDKSASLPFALSFVLDLQKAILHKGRLIKRRVMVRGKNGKTFYRMQWVDPNDKNPNISHPGGADEHTYAHHQDGIKELERRQSNRFPVVHHPTSGLKNVERNYRQDKEAFKEAEEKYHRGEKLPPVKINPFGEIVDGHHLVDLAKKHNLSHVPSIVVGNSNQKKELEDSLKDKVIIEDQNTGEKVDASTGKDPNAGLSTEVAKSVDEFKEFTKKKYTKEYLMNEAKRQGIKWDEKTKEGKALPANSKILWMRAHQAIVDHITGGGSFEVVHDEKDIDKRAQQDGKDSIHKHFVKLLEKHGSKDALMEWAIKNGIKWKEKPNHPDINWMYASVAIKKELARGKMLDGVRTRQKGKMDEANLIVDEEIKSMVKSLGQKYGKVAVMKRAEELGIEFDKFTKKGDELPSNSNILWMRAHEAIAKHISQGNQFKMGDEQDNGLTSSVGDYGGTKLSRWQGYAVDLAKRKSHNHEEKTKDWAIKAIMVDRDCDQNQAEQVYKDFMEKARNAKVMVHFDPLEMLPSGVTLLDQLSSDGEFKNDYSLNRGYDKEEREINERDMFGDEYDEAEEGERPNYGVVDLFNRGLRSHPFNGEVAFVLKDEAKKRTTGSAIDSSNVPYGQEGQWLRSMEDPHQLIVDRWRSRWKQPNKADGQRTRAFDAVLEGKSNKDGNHYFETHVHGGINFQRDVDHLLVPGAWKTDSSHADKHKQLVNFAKAHGIQVKYEE